MVIIQTLFHNILPEPLIGKLMYAAAILAPTRHCRVMRSRQSG
jgi:hypothetical protein